MTGAALAARLTGAAWNRRRAGGAAVPRPRNSALSTSRSFALNPRRSRDREGAVAWFCGAANVRERLPGRSGYLAFCMPHYPRAGWPWRRRCFPLSSCQCEAVQFPFQRACGFRKNRLISGAEVIEVAEPPIAVMAVFRTPAVTDRLVLASLACRVQNGLVRIEAPLLRARSARRGSRSAPCWRSRARRASTGFGCGGNPPSCS